MDEAVRLDVFLATSQAVLSRSQAKSWIDAGRVQVDGRPRKAGFPLRGGEWLVVDPPPPTPARAAPEDLPLRILYEAYDRWAAPPEIGRGRLMVAVAAGGLLTNLACAWLLYGDHTKDLNMRAAWLSIFS